MYWLSILALLAITFELNACANEVSTRTAPAAGTPCSVTRNPGQDIAQTLSSASAGTVVCLRPGRYPTLKLTEVHPHGYVTLRSLNARAATLAGIEGQAVDYLRLENLTVRGPISIVRAAHHIQLVGDDIGGSTCGIYLYAWPDNVISNLTIARDDIHDLNFSGPEGVCSGYGIQAVGGVQDVSITHNTIARTANDYIQLGGGSNWTVAHNLFLGPSLRYSHQTVHQDLWQVFGGGSNLRFLDNIARDTATQESLLLQQGVYRGVRIANNLFDHDSSGYSVELYQIEGLTFIYNTFVGSHWGVLFRSDDTEAGPGRGYVVEHNIFGATSGGTPDVSETPAFGSFDYNVSQDGSASGRHSLRRWRPSWAGAAGLQPLCVPFAAGYRARSSSVPAALSRRWRSGCS
jgi:nitrous oxidase accessory protein NosD